MPEADSPSERDLAVALQRVLLPPGLPDVRDWAMATLYEPAGEDVMVGGDFYDWFTLADGRVLFMVGDVSGKGPLAGALGMAIRKAMKGIAWLTEDLGQALTVLEHALSDEFDEAFATLCILEIAPDSGLARIYLAGHPPPWLRADGVFREIQAPPNSLLGPKLEDAWRAVEVELAPGDMLVLFSDGLSEARTTNGELFGEGLLGAFLQALPPHASSYETVLQIDAQLRRAVPALTDDVVIAVLTYQPSQVPRAVASGSGGVLALRLSAHSECVPLARRFVADACEKRKLSPHTRLAAELIVSELTTNAVFHSRSDLDLRVQLQPDALRIEVWDSSSVLPEIDEHPASPLLAHGRGLRLVRSLADDYGAEVTEGGKLVWAALSTTSAPGG